LSRRCKLYDFEKTETRRNKMKLTFTKEELENIIVEHNDKEDDINLHISTTDDIAKAIYAST
jgi:bisphosphoglycerate-independent phosphoglycerate mutase (AlkP superfamily)